ncbi:ABC transporter permease [Kibdelosporangium phytohabitans]|uniref:ABC transporter permease n=1 Tax=Kibdelosporangium phytohabitans TaxID=860235 RepID=UPI00147063BA|nr:ABC transporter permease [Kibdelosporangium phytohabitans]MBE1465105.1 simple sugar transport system permease protein [Kibdelosporangium phytohabitans]
MLSLDFWVLVLAGALASATPIVLAGLGETVLQRAGQFNLGIEGIMICGALAGVLGSAAAGPFAGAGFGVLAGVLLGFVFALGCLAGIDVVLVGVALTMLGVGVSTFVFQSWVPSGRTNLSVPTLPAMSVPGLSQLPGIGPLFSSIGVLTYAAGALAVLTWWVLRWTRFGLRIRAVGDSPDVAAVRGVPVSRYRAVAALIAGGFAGLAGAALSLSAIGSFSPGMSGGRGFIALAVVVVARRAPLGVLAGALLFAVPDSLGLLGQTRDTGLPVEALHALPYLVTFVVVCFESRHRMRLRQDTAI